MREREKRKMDFDILEGLEESEPFNPEPVPENEIDYEIQKLNSLLVVFCSMIEQYYNTDTTYTQELWDYIFYSDHLWKDQTRDMELRKNEWLEIVGDVPYVNSPKNIDRICVILRRDLETWLSIQSERAIESNPLVADIPVSDVDIPVSDVDILMSDDNIEIDDVTLSEEVKSLQEDLGYIKRQFLDAIPELARQRILDYLAEKYSPFILVQLRRVSKIVQNSVDSNRHFGTVRACTLLANIANKCSIHTMGGSITGDQTRLFAQIQKLQSAQELAHFSFGFSQGEVTMTRAFYDILHALAITGHNLSAIESEENPRIIGRIFGKLNLIPDSLFDLQNMISAKKLGSYNAKAVPIKKEIVMRMYVLKNRMRRVFETLNIPILFKRTFKASFHMSLPDEIPMVSIHVGNKMPQFIYLLHKYLENELTFYMNLDLLGESGYYKSGMSLPLLNRSWTTIQEVESKSLHDEILPTEILRSGAVLSMSRTSRTELVSAVYVTTIVDFEAAINYSVDSTSPWNTMLYSTLTPFDGLDHDTQMLRPKVYLFQDIDYYSTSFGFYSSMLTPILVNQPTEHAVDSQNLLQLIKSSQFDGSFAMSSLTTMSNLVRSISNIAPVQWVLRMSNYKPMIIFYQNFICFASKDISGGADRERMIDFLKLHEKYWIRVPRGTNEMDIQNHRLSSIFRAKRNIKTKAEEDIFINSLRIEKCDTFIDMSDLTSPFGIFDIVSFLQVSFPRSFYRFPGRTIGNDGNWVGLPIVMTGVKYNREIFFSPIPSQILSSMFIRYRKKFRNDVYIHHYTYFHLLGILKWIKTEASTHIDLENVDIKADFVPDAVLEKFPFAHFIRFNSLSLTDKDLREFCLQRFAIPEPYTKYSHKQYTENMRVKGKTNGPPQSDYDTKYWALKIMEGYFPEEMRAYDTSIDSKDFKSTMSIIKDELRYKKKVNVTNEHEVLRFLPALLAYQFMLDHANLIEKSRQRARTTIESMQIQLVQVQLQMGGPVVATKRPRSVFEQ